MKTCIRHIEGDWEALRKDVMAALPDLLQKNVILRKDIGKLIINGGNYTATLEEYFTKKGL